MQVAELQKLPLNPLELLVRQSNRWKDRPILVVTVLPNNDISTPQILEVVRKGTKRPDGCIRIPTRLVFDALTFHVALPQQVFEVDGKLELTWPSAARRGRGPVVLVRSPIARVLLGHYPTFSRLG